MDNHFSRRTLLSSDAENYSGRNDLQQHELQQARVDVLAVATAAAGFDRSRWSVQPAGDGELAVLPANVPEWTVIDEFPSALAHALAAYNASQRHGGRLRMRLAIHQGLVSPAAGGYAGQGVVAVSRLVDSAPARQALAACPTTDLVVLLSPALFEEVVRQGHTRMSERDFREVVVRNKTFHGSAWLHVPGHDIHALPLDTSVPVNERAEKPARPAEPVANPAVTSHIHGGVHGDNPVIGIQNRFGA
ncbi:hypothetical protein [Actinophytocola sp.]|uniref:hypothetical protein n=1 Tax=Actinophytocola sp. TaxID=1872138 RepID=UPI002ED45C31